MRYAIVYSKLEDLPSPRGKNLLNLDQSDCLHIGTIDVVYPSPSAAWMINVRH